jgi:hypothetical protein
MIAYQQLHTEELAELWKALNECKEATAAFHLQQTENSNDPFNGNDHVLERR